ncbi:hypothetical protein K458DRAFT_385018 [Lentithecium fluviatile CBS 122367]|uniref:Uncharacterized protein n=1 Tax=Lentithecium fluviatile CBS 122367 TaxID=1168545 RepID=A0A6G1JFD8_9PLEO|nr:hypothetical protein K458DRAFT_385018 [Lentithecium fluviatile CBS 122367]
MPRAQKRSRESRRGRSLLTSEPNKPFFGNRLEAAYQLSVLHERVTGNTLHITVEDMSKEDFRLSESGPCAAETDTKAVYPCRLSGRNFRLLKLLPGEMSDPIQCQLIQAPLDDPPEYEAISYA